jgi:hypothetical protein
MEKKEKYLWQYPLAALATRNKNNNNINLTLYEFGSRQTVLTIAIK